MIYRQQNTSKCLISYVAFFPLDESLLLTEKALSQVGAIFTQKKSARG